MSIVAVEKSAPSLLKNTGISDAGESPDVSPFQHGGLHRTTSDGTLSILEAVFISIVLGVGINHVAVGEGIIVEGESVLVGAAVGLAEGDSVGVGVQVAGSFTSERLAGCSVRGAVGVEGGKISLEAHADKSEDARMISVIQDLIASLGRSFISIRIIWG